MEPADRTLKPLLIDRLGEAIKELAHKGIKIESSQILTGGINSSVHQVIDSNKHKYTLKIYPSTKERGSIERCRTELIFYHYLRENKINCCPELICSSIEGHWCLLTWIEGEKPDTLNDRDIDQIATFIHQLNQKERKDEYKLALPKASDNVVNPIAWINLVEEKIKEVIQIAQNKNDRSLITWLEIKLQKKLREYKDNILNEYGYMATRNSVKYVSPSDVGVHNLIKKENSLFFIDFEYAGTDDIAKLINDWCLQPNYIFTDAQENRLIYLLERGELLQKDPEWKLRYGILKPVVMIKWCTIILKKALREKNENALQVVMSYYKNASLRISF